MRELPEGWVTTRLDDLVVVLDSFRVPVRATDRAERTAGKSPEQLYPYYGATGLAGAIDGFIFDEPLVLVGEDGVPFLDPFRPKAYLVDGPCWVNNHAHALRVVDKLADRRIVNQFLNAFDYTGYVTGSTRLKLTQEALRSIPFPLPPLPEQKRIADKLDSLFARVDACRERLDRIPAILKRFRQAVLEAATSGRLTEEWREEGSEWRMTKLWQIAQIGTGSTPLRSNPNFFAQNGTPWVTSAATSTALVEHAEKFVTPAAIKAHRLRMYPPGTLLIAMYGEGKTRGQVSELAIAATVNQACAAVSVDPARADKRFVKLALQAAYLRIRGRAEGGAQPNLSLGKVREIDVGLPSMAEQHEIVHRVEELFAITTTMEQRFQAAQKQAEALTPALLSKAFRGELVPQDPDDEPASVLLERIRAQRNGREVKPRRGRRARARE